MLLPMQPECLMVFLCVTVSLQTLWHLLLLLTHVAEVHLLHGVTSTASSKEETN